MQNPAAVRNASRDGNELRSVSKTERDERKSESARRKGTKKEALLPRCLFLHEKKSFMNAFYLYQVLLVHRHRHFRSKNKRFLSRVPFIIFHGNALVIISILNAKVIFPTGLDGIPFL